MKLWSKESYVWLNDSGTKKKTISENLSRIHTQKITKLKVENYLFDKFEKYLMLGSLNITKKKNRKL